MKHILFHSNQLGLRGTEIALYDYAHYNETILGNKSFICADKNGNMDALKKFQKRFPDIFLYDKFEEAQKYAETKGITHAYFIKAGNNDGKIIKGCKNIVHAVFQEKDPHGDEYVYVSKWLGDKMGGKYLPHIVWLPEPTRDYRDALGIPADATVWGRYGGYNEFDIPFVYQKIKFTTTHYNDRYFLFMNTAPFCDPHPQIIHVNSTWDLQNKANFIATCDYMIHARYQGESFGLAIAEFLFGKKPVFSFSNSLDQHHYQLLNNSPRNVLYSGFNDLKFEKDDWIDPYVHLCVEKFSPERVMQRFNEFL